MLTANAAKHVVADSCSSQTTPVRTTSSQVDENRGVKQVPAENQCSSKPYVIQKASSLLIPGDCNCIEHKISADWNFCNGQSGRK